MKLTKQELEMMVMEAIQEEVEELSQEDLQELLGGLKGVVGAAGRGLSAGAKAVSGAVKGAGQAVGGAAQKAGQAVSGAAQKAAGAVKGAYQAGETRAAVQSVSKGIANAIATVDKSIQTVAQTDPNLADTLDNVKGGLQSAALALNEGQSMGMDPLIELIIPEDDLMKFWKSLRAEKSPKAPLVRDVYAKLQDGLTVPEREIIAVKYLKSAMRMTGEERDNALSKAASLLGVNPALFERRKKV